MVYPMTGQPTLAMKSVYTFILKLQLSTGTFRNDLPVETDQVAVFLATMGIMASITRCATINETDLYWPKRHWSRPWRRYGRRGSRLGKLGRFGFACDMQLVEREAFIGKNARSLMAAITKRVGFRMFLYIIAGFIVIHQDVAVL